MRRSYCQLCRRLIDADFGDPHLCHACIDARLDERFARWSDDWDAAPVQAVPPAAA
jgi:hypothetical protein